MTVRLRYLDGLRGLAAVAVMYYHALQFTGSGNLKPGTAFERFLIHLLSLGHFAVPVFIVLSGFSLGLPIARSEDRKLSGGVGGYFQRRARRIIPPYFIAIAATMLLIASVPIMQSPMGTRWDGKIPYDAKDVAMHLLLIHPFSADRLFRINGPLWSVGVEWWLYFLLPFVIVPLWRKLKEPGLGLAVLLIGAVFIVAGKKLAPQAHLWFGFLFALGIFSAATVVDPKFAKLRNPILWRVIGALSLQVVLAIAAIRPDAQDMKSELAIGVATCVFLIYWGVVKSPKVLETEAGETLAGFSYSLYLIHTPILALINLLLLKQPLSDMTRLLVMMFVAAPIALAISYGFSLVAERPFQRVRKVAAAPSST